MSVMVMEKTNNLEQELEIAKKKAPWKEITRAIRTEFGWSQVEFAAKMGVFQASISRWERGEAVPSLDQRIALLRLAASRQINIPYHGEQGSAHSDGLTVRFGVGEAQMLHEISASFTVHVAHVVEPDKGSVWALVVEGNHLWPRYDDGDVILVCGERLSPEEALGEEVVVWLANGGTGLKRIRRGSEPGRYTLDNISGPPNENVIVRSVSLVRSVLRRATRQ